MNTIVGFIMYAWTQTLTDHLDFILIYQPEMTSASEHPLTKPRASLEGLQKDRFHRQIRLLAEQHRVQSLETLWVKWTLNIFVSDRKTY